MEQGPGRSRRSAALGGGPAASVVDKMLRNTMIVITGRPSSANFGSSPGKHEPRSTRSGRLRPWRPRISIECFRDRESIGQLGPQLAVGAFDLAQTRTSLAKLDRTMAKVDHVLFGCTKLSHKTDISSTHARAVSRTRHIRAAKSGELTRSQTRELTRT